MLHGTCPLSCAEDAVSSNIAPTACWELACKESCEHVSSDRVGGDIPHRTFLNSNEHMQKLLRLQTNGVVFFSAFMCRGWCSTLSSTIPCKSQNCPLFTKKNHQLRLFVDPPLSKAWFQQIFGLGQLPSLPKECSLSFVIFFKTRHSLKCFCPFLLLVQSRSQTYEAFHHRSKTNL